MLFRTDVHPRMRLPNERLDVLRRTNIVNAPQQVAVQLDRAVAVPALVRPLDEVRIEDVSDLGRHQGAGEFLFKLAHLADDGVIAVACIQGLPEGAVGMKDFENVCR